jgi:gliding motility-associated-like protein
VLKYEISQLGCSSIDSVTIYNNLPTIANAGSDDVICTDSVELRPNTPTFGVGEWRVIEGSAKFVGNWAKELAPGRNVLEWVITSANCESSDQVVIINNKPSTAFAGHDRTICVDEVNLSANIPQYGTGSWTFISGSGNIQDVTDPYSHVTGLASGANRFRWTIDNNGCISSDDVEISNHLIPALAGVNQVNCADTAVLEANFPAPGTGTWGVVGGSGSAIFAEPDNPYTIVRGLDQGDNVLTWTVNHQGCTSVSQVVIRNDNPTVAKAGDNIGLCVNTTQLAANTPTVGTGSWTLRNGGGVFEDATNPATRINDLKFGDNLLRWTIVNQGCVSHDDVEVSFNRIDAMAGSDLATCSPDTILEANNAGPGIGTWSVVGGGTSQAIFDDQNSANSRVSNLAKGSNVLRWTINYRGCQTFDEVNVVNNSPSTAYAGNTQELCEDITVLDATPVSIGVGHWEILTGSATIPNVNDPKANVSNLSKGDNVFRWVVQNGACSLADEVLVVNNRPSEPYAGKDETICYPNMTLKANVPEHGSGLWTIEQGSGNFSNPTDPAAEVENLTPGVNVLRWTLTKGQCTLSDDIIITNDAPTVSNAGPDIQDCKDYSQLDANIPTQGSGSWTVVSGRGDFDDPTDAKTTVRNLGFGENILMWSIENGECISSDQVIIFNQVPDPSDAGSDRTICEDYVVLNANNPNAGTGTWTVISGSGEFEDDNLYNTQVNNLGVGVNVFKWTIAYADSECYTESTVTITSHKTDPYAGEDDVVYEPVYEMQAANPGSSLSGTWTVVAGSGDFDDAGFFNTTVRNLGVGNNTFRWTIESNGCSAYDDVTITYKEVPDAGFQVDADNGCYPLDVKFTNYSVGGTSFTWDFGDGSPISTDRNPTHTYQDPGTYTAVLTVPGPDGQDAVFSQLITVHDHPVADFNVEPTTVYVPGDVVRFYDLSSDAAVYTWDFGDGNTSEESNPSHEYADEGIYSVQLTVRNQFGCEDVLLKEDLIEAKLKGFVSFPNAFMPRPDASSTNDINAIFKPVFRDVDQYHLQIFNRWGQLIFESHDVTEGWDGMYKDKLSPQAVYVWKVSGTYISGRTFRKTGSVLLVR